MNDILPHEIAPPAVVVKQIGDFVDSVVSAISLIDYEDTRDPPGEHNGTGSFIALNGITYLVTCEHVARHGQGSYLGYSQFGSNFAVSMPTSFRGAPFPIDMDAAPISTANWQKVPHSAKCLGPSALAKQHLPVPGELFYIYGFPSDNATAFTGEHHHQGVGIFTREAPYDARVEDEPPPIPINGFHIFFSYGPELASQVSGSSATLPKGPGFSGSLVWNTRYVERCMRGETWTPHDLRVTALLWGHSMKAGLLVATPIDHLHRYFDTLY